MAKLSTKDLTKKEVSKMLSPGNNICQVLSLKLESIPYKQGAYHLNLQVEGQDLGKDFEGFFIDKNNPALGRHKGQIGKIRASEYPFADGETKSGIKVNRDRDILKFIKNLCLVTGATEWFDSQDGQHETIELFVENFDNVKPFKEKFLRMCIAGNEYQNKQGYTNYNLYLPKPSRNNFSFESITVSEENSRICIFNPDIHKKKKKVDQVESFGKPVTQATKDQFSLD